MVIVIILAPSGGHSGNPEKMIAIPDINNQGHLTESDKRLKPQKQTTGNPDTYPVKLDDTVFAIEQYECSAISGHWAIVYEGVVIATQGDNVFVRLDKRLGYRFRPQLEGIDRTNWWCIPLRRHCYSVVKFSDWNGQYVQNQVAFFPGKRVYYAKIRIVDAVAPFLQQMCERKKFKTK